jgi:hypothetical protein
VRRDQLNQTARRFASALLRDFPQFAADLSILPDGHFSASIQAPPRSKARAIRCFSMGEGDVWIQLAVRNAFYSVDSVPEMRRVLRGVLADALGFVLISRSRKWTGTTLAKLDAPPALRMLRPGDVARVISWSGTRDHIVRHAVSVPPGGQPKARPSGDGREQRSAKGPDRAGRSKRHAH